MNKFIITFTAIALFLAMPVANAENVTPPMGAPYSFADLSEKLSPAVVNISSIQKVSPNDGMDNLQTFPDFPGLPPESPLGQLFRYHMEQQRQQFEQNVQPVTSLGSGFIIDADKGLIVTNNHVIKDADEVKVTLFDNTVLTADIVGRDEKIDLAVLKVKKDKHKLTAVKFGNSDVVRVGDWIIAIGNPFGLGGTVTAGIISARKRDISAGPYDDFLQTDASINRGNSGGPMFNLKGEVIGINTAIYSPSGGSVGIGFAVPANLAKPIIDQLIEFGKTRRGWIGVKIQTVTPDIAGSFGLTESKGALVASVSKGSPADVAGIKSGDIILEFNNQELNAMRQLPRIVAETPIGKDAPVKIWRDGKVQILNIKIAELEKAETEGKIQTAENNSQNPMGGKSVELSGLGVAVANITPALRQTYNIPADVNGVVVTKSSSIDGGVTAGDIILEINQTPVTNAAIAANLVASAQKAGKDSVLLLVDNGGRGDVRFVGLKFQKTEKPKYSNSK